MQVAVPISFCVACFCCLLTEPAAFVAVTVNVDAERGVANQIAPGDHVDIATTLEDVSGNPATGYLLRDVKVLAVGSSTVLQQNAATGGAAGAPLEVSGLLTFEVSSDDALRVIAANNGGKGLYLVLLPPQATTAAATAASTK